MSTFVASEKTNHFRSISERMLLVLSFTIGVALAVASADRGANCQAGFHFLTIFIWLRLFGQGLTLFSIRTLDAVLNGLILTSLAWTVLRATKPFRVRFRLSCLVALHVLYALLMFVAFPMKDCL